MVWWQVQCIEEELTYATFCGGKIDIHANIVMAKEKKKQMTLDDIWLNITPVMK